MFKSLNLDGTVLGIRLIVFASCFSLAAFLFLVAIIYGRRKDKNEDAIMVDGRSFKRKLNRWLSLSPRPLCCISGILAVLGFLGILNYKLALIVALTILYCFAVDVSEQSVPYSVTACGTIELYYPGDPHDVRIPTQYFRNPTFETIFEVVVAFLWDLSLALFLPGILTVCFINLFGIMGCLFGLVSVVACLCRLRMD